MVDNNKKKKTGIEAAKAIIAKREGTGNPERRIQRNYQGITPGRGQKFSVGTGKGGKQEVTQEEYNQIRAGIGGGGTLPTPETLSPKISGIISEFNTPITQKETDIESFREQVIADPSQFGLDVPVVRPEGLETTSTPGEQLEPVTDQSLVERQPGEKADDRPFGERLLDPFGDQEVIGGTLPIGGAGAGAFKVGGKIISSSKAAMKAGTAAKWTKGISESVSKISKYGGAILTLLGTLTVIETVGDILSPKKIDEQQQALNTLGQMATTIAGDATESAGDWKKGLQELQYIKSEVLKLESAIQSGKIAKAAIKFNGKIYDINADMSDQLGTIDEQITIIRSFVIEGKFPDLEPLEIQGILRELEEGGFVEPVDFTTSRRPGAELQ